MQVLSQDQILRKFQSINPDSFAQYWAYYSGLLEGISTDPRWMMIPLDDHMVHRGDGVFEALKWTGKKIYLMEEHLARLERSAQMISLPLPKEWSSVREILLQVARTGAETKPSDSAAVLRIFVSRGPGNFSANPYDSKKSFLYVVMTDLKAPSSERYEVGVSLGKSLVLPKPSPWAEAKTCNYLPNVLMKKEAVDRKLDFVVGFDESGFMTESSTENVLILSARRELVKPRAGRLLQGTTMNRVWNWAKSLGSPILGEVKEENISETMLRNAKEVLVLGTTWDVLPVRSYEDVQYTERAFVKLALEFIRKDQASS